MRQNEYLIVCMKKATIFVVIFFFAFQFLTFSRPYNGVLTFNSQSFSELPTAWKLIPLLTPNTSTTIFGDLRPYSCI